MQLRTLSFKVRISQRSIDSVHLYVGNHEPIRVLWSTSNSRFSTERSVYLQIYC